MRLSLMLFSGCLAASASEQYSAVMQIAEFGDTHDFRAIWLPERHFTNFGGPYPNPLLALAAIASRTKRIKLGAGSLVAPLHDPIRVAEDLSMLDNLSDGRVEISFASGWHPNDFVFYPERYQKRRELTFDLIEIVSRLWAGHEYEAMAGSNETIALKMMPRPKQSRLPISISAAQSAQTFRTAGLKGYGILTHLLDGNLQALADNIKVYEIAHREAGHHTSCKRVVLMLHTYLGSHESDVRSIIRKPYVDYLRSIAPLAQGVASARGKAIDWSKLDSRHVDQFTSLHFERAFDGRSLMGTEDMAIRTLSNMRRIGVDEVACLVDFGLASTTVIEQLPRLASLNDRVQRECSTLRRESR